MSLGSAFGKTQLGRYIVKETNKSLMALTTKGINPTSTRSLTQSVTFTLDGQPVWKDFKTMRYLLESYCENPIVQAVINIKADAFSNMKFLVKKSDGEIIPIDEYEDDGGVLRKLIANPNPLQSTFEWLKQYQVNKDVFGNGYSYATMAVGFEKSFTYQDITSIKNLPPYCVVPVPTGQWLEATTKDEMIKGYVFQDLNNKKRPLNTNQVFHTNNVNIKHDRSFLEGSSELIALYMPISNIFYAYESRNVLIRKRGALGILSSDKGNDDIQGSIPLNDDEVEQVQEQFKQYGLLDDQYSQIISPVALKYTKMAMSVKELMLFEEIESDAIAVANAFGVPELLAKYYLKGGTFKNLDAAEKRLYDSTVIPESKDFMIALNSFLKTEQLGIELIGSFDHINALQINKKEEAQTNKLNQESALDAFKIGAIDYNTYLSSMKLPNDDAIGGLRIWDLTPEQQNAIGINVTAPTNGEE